MKIEKRFHKKVFKNNFNVFYYESTVKGLKKEVLCSGKFVTNSMYVYYLNDNSFLKDIDSNFLNVNSIVFSKKKYEILNEKDLKKWNRTLVYNYLSWLNSLKSNYTNKTTGFFLPNSKDVSYILPRPQDTLTVITDDMYERESNFGERKLLLLSSINRFPQLEY